MGSVAKAIFCGFAVLIEAKLELCVLTMLFTSIIYILRFFWKEMVWYKQII